MILLCGDDTAAARLRPLLPSLLEGGAAARSKCSLGTLVSSSARAPASSGRAWWLRAARDSQGDRPGHWGVQPLPRVLEQAASKAADSTVF